MDFIASMAGGGHNLPIKSSGLSDWLKLKAVIQRPFGDRQPPTQPGHSAEIWTTVLEYLCLSLFGVTSRLVLISIVLNRRYRDERQPLPSPDHSGGWAKKSIY
ncbi:MAG: hypothetical protein V3R72_10740 [Gammaproteobacteria bacterium]